MWPRADISGVWSKSDQLGQGRNRSAVLTGHLSQCGNQMSVGARTICTRLGMPLAPIARATRIESRSKLLAVDLIGPMLRLTP